jgi:hypothetical protein
MSYILYKNPIQLDTLDIVQYLYSRNLDAQPFACIERNFPENITQIPTIYDLETKRT